ncbi:MAG: BspA family leucine-rich repeat surface protein, partial [Promicromonosporaceae bacterium]|nr:BspA family leucine-rich repeat surface protein [Promicromonosporaceae bacterium]
PWAPMLPTGITRIEIIGPVVAGTQLSALFRGLEDVTEISGLEYLDTSAVRLMNSLFEGTSSLAALDLSTWDTSSVERMDWMFSGASSLTSLDLSTWDVSNVVTMSSMFRDTSSLSHLDVSGWDTSSAQHMSWMFAGADSLSNVDVSGWDTSNVFMMNGMFFRTSSLEALDVSGWDTGNVWHMGQMFEGNHTLVSLDLSSWDVSNVTNMRQMFAFNTNLFSLNLDGWDINPGSDTWNMFWDAISLCDLWLSAGFVIPADQNVGLPNLPQTAAHAGRWQNVADGTVDSPAGDLSVTSAELMAMMAEGGDDLADRWVCQALWTGSLEKFYTELYLYYEEETEHTWTITVDSPVLAEVSIEAVTDLAEVLAISSLVPDSIVTTATAADGSAVVPSLVAHQVGDNIVWSGNVPAGGSVTVSYRLLNDSGLDTYPDFTYAVTTSTVGEDAAPLILRVRDSGPGGNGDGDGDGDGDVDSGDSDGDGDVDSGEGDDDSDTDSDVGDGDGTDGDDDAGGDDGSGGGGQGGRPTLPVTGASLAAAIAAAGALLIGGVALKKGALKRAKP